MIEWLRANGYVCRDSEGSLLFCLDSPMGRKLSTEQKVLKRQAINYLRAAHAQYDFVHKRWMLSSERYPDDYRLVTGGQQ